MTERDFIREIEKKVDLEFENDEHDNTLDEETKERRRILKKQMKKILYERHGILYESFKKGDEKIEQEKEPLLLNS